jgi:hypothetical protein
VPASKVIPAEVVLQRSLEKIAKYGVIFGIVEPPAASQKTVILKYLGWRRETTNLRRIFQGINRQPSSLRWTEFVRRHPGAWWRSQCNGVALQLGPWLELPGMLMPVTAAISRDKHLRPLAGTLLPTLIPEVLQQLLEHDANLAKNYPGLAAYKAGPIRLIWRGFATKR